MIENQDLESISDDSGHTLFYRLNLQENPKDLPLLVVLHDHESTATKFIYDGWNVLAPLDNFGYLGKGSWWLGENGNFFLRDLLQKLIKEVSIKYNCENNIYFYGSSMGGYGAILHGILSNARAVYANVPQIKFFNSTYFKLNLTKNANTIFNKNEDLPIENNLLDVLDKYKSRKLPIFFLCENMIQDSRVYNNYLQEHTMAFANKCIENKIKIHLELLPQSGHTKNYGLKEVLKKFEKFVPFKVDKMCNLKKKFTLTSNNWFENKKEKYNKVTYSKDRINLDLNFNIDSNPYYLVSGSSSTSSVDENSKTYDISSCDKFVFIFNIDFNNNCEFKFYILQFDHDGKKIDTKSFSLKNGTNEINYSKTPNAKYLKVAFRVHSNTNKNINIQISKFVFGLDKINNNISSFEIYDYGKNNNINDFNPIIKFNQYLHHKMQLDKFKIDILSHYKRDSNKLVVFYNGAVNVKKTPSPVFQRWSWLEKLPYSAIIISDPTILEMQKKYNDETLIGWYQGSFDNFILKEINEFIKSIISKLDISSDNVVFYGSSAGGFASLVSSVMLKGSKACVVNPQIDIMKYHKSHSEKLLDHLNITNVKEKFQQKEKDINIISLLKDEQVFPQVFYKQNKLDELHYSKHYLAFKELYKQQNQLKNLHSEIIEDNRGHSAIPKYDEAKIDIDKTFEIYPSINDETTIDKIILKEMLDIQLFTLVNNKSTLDSFTPRKDTLPFEIILPLDWNIDPYSDRNWCYQLHAWRMIDHKFFEYEKNKNISKLMECLPILEDWERYTIFENHKTEMTWNDMATGLRALKIGFIINRLFTEDTIHLISDSNKYMLIREAKKHIEELNSQKISLNNHGIFQVHGLLVLAWLLDDKKSIDYALMHMNNLINQQFYPEGIHSENSDDYHWFIYATFNDIMKFEPYKNDENIQTIMKNAEECKIWTVFPNNQSLMIGDSSDSIRKVINKPLDNKDNIIIKYFRDSGYLFIRSTFQTLAKESSMLFFQTAYKNKTHRHSDDFNILLYEYGKNILVDSGKYAYENNNNRRYAVSTKAHNCVSIDNINYEFKGKDTYESVLEYAKYEDYIYKIKTSIYRNKMEVTHNRNIIYKPKEFCIVIDMLISKKKRNYDQFWHFHQDLELMREKDYFTTDINDTISMKIEPTIVNLDKFNTKIGNDKLNIKLMKGQTEPELQGWRSLKYKEMIENYALQNSVKAKKALLITKFIFTDKSSNENDLNISIHKKKSKIICHLASKSLEIDSNIIL